MTPANRILILLMLIVPVLSACGPIRANIPVAPRAAEAPEVLLFVGNSFTFFNGGLENHVKKLADSANPPRSIKVDSVTQGGATLKILHNGRWILDTIRRGGFDVVILQEDIPELTEHSVEPFFEYARLFDQEIRDVGAKSVLFMAWPYERLNWVTLDEIAQAHREIGSELGVPVAPIGIAFQRAMEERPELPMLGYDKEHESIHGTYLAANVIYATLFGQNPEGFTYYPSGVSAEEAAFLQRIAWDTVQDWQSQDDMIGVSAATSGWPTSIPEDQDIDSAKLAQALLTMRARNIQIHSLLVIRNGAVVADAYFYPYDGSTVHDLASVTKSVMTTLIAIAAGQGKLDLDQPLVSFFPDRPIANLDERKERITVRHLASMASGLESMGFAQDEGTLTEMQASPDYVQFALDRKAVAEPGTQFVYDSPGMHLLSAILQQATGMTALEFAQENLFAPLGIEEVIWPSDDQGVTHGWGDLHLHPHDAAKLGYLWLNGGAWDGKQIVPREWVEESVKVQSEVPNDEDDYGYGWWVAPDGGQYSAKGRGGQFVRVYPNANAIVVTTGGGLDYDLIEPLVAATLIDPEQPLPPNPDGIAQLESATAAVALPPAPEPVAVLPSIAQEVSGKVYAFEPNQLEVDALGLVFDGSAEATLLISPAGSGQIVSWPIGLDGLYRFSQDDLGLPQGMRGTWTDDGSFVMEYNDFAGNSHLVLRTHFKGDRMIVTGSEYAHDLGIRIEGVLQAD